MKRPRLLLLSIVLALGAGSVAWMLSGHDAKTEPQAAGMVSTEPPSMSHEVTVEDVDSTDTPRARTPDMPAVDTRVDLFDASLPLSARMPGLMKAAEQGQAEASCRAVRILARCGKNRLRLRVKAEQAERLVMGATQGSEEEAHLLDEAAALSMRVEHEELYCAGITDVSVFDEHQLMVLAAEHGDAQMATRLVVEGIPLRDDMPEPTPAQMAQMVEIYRLRSARMGQWEEQALRAGDPAIVRHLLSVSQVIMGFQGARRFDPQAVVRYAHLFRRIVVEGAADAESWSNPDEMGFRDATLAEVDQVLADGRDVLDAADVAAQVAEADALYEAHFSGHELTPERFIQSIRTYPEDDCRQGATP